MLLVWLYVYHTHNHLPRYPSHIVYIVQYCLYCTIKIVLIGMMLRDQKSTNDFFFEFCSFLSLDYYTCLVTPWMIIIYLIKWVRCVSLWLFESYPVVNFPTMFFWTPTSNSPLLCEKNIGIHTCGIGYIQLVTYMYVHHVASTWYISTVLACIMMWLKSMGKILFYP